MHKGKGGLKTESDKGECGLKGDGEKTGRQFSYAFGSGLNPCLYVLIPGRFLGIR